jgi:type II secretory ATPase GspE/PulE/Tfp pilus assembly ATPase PilB-like protein
LQTGYHGRVPLVECLRVTDSMRRRIAAHDLETFAAKPSLAENAASLVQTGQTDVAEVRRVLG